MALFPIAKIKAHSLTGRITQPLLRAAFKAVKRNRGAAGIDKVSIKMFEANLADNLLALELDLKNGSFEPFPLRRKFLDKGGGKFRPLGIPAVRDRVAQEVLRRLLQPIFEPLFHEASFGFRPRRNCHQALELAIKYTMKAFELFSMQTSSAVSTTCPSRLSRKQSRLRSPTATSSTSSRNSFAQG